MDRWSDSGQCGRLPHWPLSDQRSIRCEQPALDPTSANAETGEEIDGIMQRTAELECERSLVKPRRGRENEGHRHIGERRCDQEAGEISGWASLGGGT